MAGLSITTGIMIRLNLFTAVVLGCVTLLTLYTVCYVSLEPSGTHQSGFRLPLTIEEPFTYPLQITDRRVPYGIHKGVAKQQEQQAKPTILGYYQTYPQQPLYR